MCGIGGVFNKSKDKSVEPQILVNMAAIQSHRGPDGFGYKLSDDASVGFCHARLSIIDLNENRARQPFVGGAVGGYAQKVAQDNGLLIRAVAGSSLGFCPPLIITNEQIDEMIEIVAIALDAALDHCKKENLLT